MKSLSPPGLGDKVEQVRDLGRLLEMEICHHDMRLVQGSDVPETVAQQITRDILAGEARPLTESVVVAEPVAGLESECSQNGPSTSNHLAQQLGDLGVIDDRFGQARHMLRLGQRYRQLVQGANSRLHPQLKAPLQVDRIPRRPRADGAVRAQCSGPAPRP